MSIPSGPVGSVPHPRPLQEALQGLGRILAEHDQLICTVQTVDPDKIPPTWGFNIPVYAGPFSQAMIPAVLRGGTP